MTGSLEMKELGRPRLLGCVLLAVYSVRFDCFDGSLQLLLNINSKMKGADHGWVDADCFHPLDHPIIGKDHTRNSTGMRIINVGFPKCGSSTLYKFLDSSPMISASHYWPCGAKPTYGVAMPCALCVQASIARGIPPLATCGDFTAYTQMDTTPFRFDNSTNAINTCIFPQISYLNEFYEENPEAIFVLPFRNVSAWIRSMGAFNHYRERITKFCEFPEYNFTKDMGKEDHELERLYCSHVRHIRRFVSGHPSLTLVEYAIDGDGVGHYLSSVIPYLNGSNYGHENANKNKAYASHAK
jgi:hypothetical protein